MNKIILSGSVCSDVLLKAVVVDSKTKSVASTRIAIPNEENEEKVSLYVDLVFWGNVAESANLDIKKGDYIELDGKLNIRKYVNKAGVTIHKTEIIVSNFRVVNRMPTPTLSQDLTSNEPTLSYQDEELPF